MWIVDHGIPSNRLALGPALRAAGLVLAGALLTISIPARSAGADYVDPQAERPVRVDQMPVLGQADLDSADSAAGDALSALENAPVETQVACASDDGTEICIRRREAEPAGSPTVPPGSEVLLGAAVASQPLSHASQVCDGTGADGYRVQVVYAHTSVSPDPAQVARISTSLANVDAAFAGSASRTGGARQVRWVTDSGSPGCVVTVRTARITTGATDFGALLADLEGQGAVTAVGAGTTKHLIFSEGQMVNPATDTCGVGESFSDDRPVAASPSNKNLLGTRAAVDGRCWDINGGGSVPAHELMHTLGAVQSSAPHTSNSGHCNDEYDLMCYGPGMTYPCPAASDNALFDCGNDDYFNTDPLAGQYLCDHWNTSDSAYLKGWSDAQPPRAVRNLSVTSSAWCHLRGPRGNGELLRRRLLSGEYQGVGTVDTSATTSRFNAPPGTYTVTVRPHSPYGAGFGASASTTVTVLNNPPVGRMVLSLTDGRGYGMFGYAIDPETGGPVRMRVTIPGVVSREFDWNYTWADMPRFTGVNRHRVARLPRPVATGHPHGVLRRARSPGWRLDPARLQDPRRSSRNTPPRCALNPRRRTTRRRSNARSRRRRE